MEQEFLARAATVQEWGSRYKNAAYRSPTNIEDCQVAIRFKPADKAVPVYKDHEGPRNPQWRQNIPVDEFEGWNVKDEEHKIYPAAAEVKEQEHWIEMRDKEEAGAARLRYTSRKHHVLV